MRTFLKLLIVSLLTISLLLFLISYGVNTIVKNAINEYGSAITGTEVGVNKIKFSIDGKGELESFNVHNPENFSSESFFKVNSVSTEIDIKSFFSTVKVINSIKIEKPLIRLELDNEKNSNLDMILKNVMKFSQKIKVNNTSTKQESAVSKLILKELLLKDVTLKLLVPHTKKIITLGLSPIYLQDIGLSEGGVLPNQLVELIIKKIQQQIINEKISGLMNYKKQIKKTKKRIKDLESKTKEKLRNKIDEKINNLF